MSDQPQDNRAGIITTKEKSEDDFEKNLVFITSGTLVLSLTFIEKIAPLTEAKGVWFLIIAWTLLALSLLGNLISHQLSGFYSQAAIDDIEAGMEVPTINARIRARNSIITKWNIATVGLMISGIFCLVVYCSINALQMSNKIGGDKGNVFPKPNNDDFSKGRTVTPLPMPRPATPPPPPPSTKEGGKNGR